MNDWRTQVDTAINTAIRDLQAFAAELDRYEVMYPTYVRAGHRPSSLAGEHRASSDRPTPGFDPVDRAIRENHRRIGAHIVEISRLATFALRRIRAITVPAPAVEADPECSTPGCTRPLKPGEHTCGACRQARSRENRRAQT